MAKALSEIFLRYFLSSKGSHVIFIGEKKQVEEKGGFFLCVCVCVLV